MDAPAYGTEPSERLPLYPVGVGASARVLTGSLGSAVGPFKAQSDVFIADVEIAAGATAAFDISATHDNALAYVYSGSASSAGGAPVPLAHAVRFGAETAARGIELTAGADGLRALVFSGKRLKQKIAWHGPFVMTTADEIAHCLQEYRTGTFLKVRAPYDYKSAAAGRAWHAKQAALATAPTAAGSSAVVVVPATREL